MNERPTEFFFGAGGTGKSTLGRKLAGEPGVGGSYLVSPVPENSKLEHVPFGKVTVFPGQPRRRDVYIAEINERLGANIRLLIHVVANGYHSLDTDTFTIHKSYTAGDDAERFMQKHKRTSLDEEIKVLEEITPLIIGSPRDSMIQLITLVSKQDLWWHERHEARSHYTNPDGDYAKLVAKMLLARGQHFEHTCLSASFEQLNLMTNTGELLAATAAGYDDRIQDANVQEFVRHFHAVCGVKK
jgi:hypothetical protein